MKKILLVSSVVVLLSTASLAFAASASVYVSPASGNETAGSAFSAAVGVDPAGNKACVVQGTVVFSGAICENISVASGIIAQTAPTCASPSFVLGIPKCATAAQTLFGITLSGGAGIGTVLLSGVKVIGAGADVPSTSSGASFEISAAPVQQSATAKTTTTTKTQNAPAESAPATTTTPAAASQTPSTSGTGISNTVGEAAVSSTMSGLLESPVFVGIVLFIIGLLSGLWLSDIMKRQKKA